MPPDNTWRTNLFCQGKLLLGGEEAAENHNVTSQAAIILSVESNPCRQSVSSQLSILFNDSLLTKHLKLFIFTTMITIFFTKSSLPFILVDNNAFITVKVAISGAIGGADQHSHQLVGPGHHLSTHFISMDSW